MGWVSISVVSHDIHHICWRRLGVCVGDQEPF